MTLAIILFTYVFLFAAFPHAACEPIQAAAQQSSPAQQPDSTPAQPQNNNSQNTTSSEPQTPPAATNPAPSPTPTPTPPAKKGAASKRRHRKKPPATAAASDCPKSAPAGSAAASGSESAAKADAAGEGKTATNCPPAKTVVHDGSTTEPSIQLVGGAGTQKTADQRTTADQLVGSTEENLKKIAGRQLDSNQQELLKQIQQFLDQSKAALAAGDIERGHNLALKAHLLSDELAKP